MKSTDSACTNTSSRGSQPPNSTPHHLQHKITTIRVPYQTFDPFETQVEIDAICNKSLIGQFLFFIILFLGCFVGDYTVSGFRSGQQENR